MTANDDLRRLAATDFHTKSLAHVSDQWITNAGFKVRSVGDVAVVMQKLACPVEPSSTGRIIYWAVDHTLSDLTRQLARSSLLALTEAHLFGSPSIWGWVQNPATHLAEFLDDVVDAGACRKFPGEETDDVDYSDGTFYVADIDPARRYMNEALRA